MSGQHVKLIVRQVGLNDDDPIEMVTAVEVGDQRLELPMGSDLMVEYKGAGDSIAVIHLVLVASTVRYEPEGGWVIKTDPHPFEPDDGIRKSCCDQPRNAKIHRRTDPHPYQGADINKGYDLPCCFEPREAEIHQPVGVLSNESQRVLEHYGTDEPEKPSTFTGVETVEGLPAGDGRVIEGTDHSWCCPLDNPCLSHKLRFSPEVPADHLALSEYKYNDPEA